jgi:putative FmdB family regulatory protein
VSLSVPTYDYECRSCGHRIEVIHSMLDDGPTACQRCAGPLRRILYPTGIIFKGSGFYSTDSRSSGSASPTPAPAKGTDSAPAASSEPAGSGSGAAAASTPDD